MAQSPGRVFSDPHRCRSRCRVWHLVGISPPLPPLLDVPTSSGSQGPVQPVEETRQTPREAIKTGLRARPLPRGVVDVPDTDAGQI